MGNTNVSMTSPPTTLVPDHVVTTRTFYVDVLQRTNRTNDNAHSNIEIGEYQKYGSNPKTSIKNVTIDRVHYKFRIYDDETVTTRRWCSCLESNGFNRNHEVENYDIKSDLSITAKPEERKDSSSQARIVQGTPVAVKATILTAFIYSAGVMALGLFQKGDGVNTVS